MPRSECFTALQQRIGGRWLVRWNAATGTPEHVLGSGFRCEDWRGDSANEARRQAIRFLESQGDLLGTRGLDLREVACERMGRTWVLRFEQVHAGLPVHGSRVEVRVHERGVISMVGAVVAALDASFDVLPAVDEGAAFATAFVQQRRTLSRERQPVAPRRPRLVLLLDPAASVRTAPKLCWEVSVCNLEADGSGEVGRYFVDAKRGEVVHFENDKHACAHRSARGRAPREMPPTPTTITVMAWTQTAPSGAAAAVNVPMARFQFSVPGIGPVTTDQNGQVTVDLTAPVVVSVSNVDGVHHAPVQPTFASPVQLQVSPGVPAILQLFAASASDTQLAHSNVAYWVDRTNEWARTVFGNTPQLAQLDGILPTVNLAPVCDAFYVGNTISFYSADPAAPCRNSAFSTVVAHEWGHGLDDRFGGIANVVGDGLSEGWGDVVAMYLLDTPDMALDFFAPVGSVLRSGNNTVRYGTQTEVHLAGQSWMGFAWQVRQNLRAAVGTAEAVRVSNAIVLGSIVANARNQADAVTEVFLADDDDGNVWNGVPHFAALSAAAQAKGLPYPHPQVAVVSHTPLRDTANPHGARGVRAVAFPTSGGAITQMTLVHSQNGGPEVTVPMVRSAQPDEWLGLVPGIARGVVRYRIEALHDSGAIVRSPVLGDHVYSVVENGLDAFRAFVTEDFEGGGVGWTNGRVGTTGGNDWQVDRPAGFGGIAQGIPWTDAPGAFGGRFVLGNSVRGGGTTTGQYLPSSDCYARSPSYDCTGRSHVFLRFRRWLTVQSGVFDRATVRVNGALVWSNPVDQDLVDVQWQLVEIPIPMADGSASVQIEFGLATDNGIELGGWNVDDVQLGERVPLVQAPVLRITPERLPPFSPVTIDLRTAPGMPFVFVVADQNGPTPLPFPGLPDALVSGNALVELFAFADATGAFTYSFPTARVPFGFLFHSQALTLDANGQPVLTNGCTNLMLP